MLFLMSPKTTFRHANITKNWQLKENSVKMLGRSNTAVGKLVQFVGKSGNGWSPQHPVVLVPGFVTDGEMEGFKMIQDGRNMGK